MLASLPGLLVSVLILLTFRQRWIILDFKKQYFQFRDPRQDTAKETAAAGANRRRDGFRKWIMEYLKKLLVTFFSPTMMILLLAGERNNGPLLSPNPP